LIDCEYKFADLSANTFHDNMLAYIHRSAVKLRVSQRLTVEMNQFPTSYSVNVVSLKSNARSNQKYLFELIQLLIGVRVNIIYRDFLFCLRFSTILNLIYILDVNIHLLYVCLCLSFTLHYRCRCPATYVTSIRLS